MVDFEWYRSFVAIYKHNSVSEAAKIRIMTQPAMSQHLAALEAEVGEKLFIRTTRSLVPTERGKQLYSRVAPLIESLEERTMRLKQHQSSSLETIKLGTTQELFAEKVLTQLSQFKWSTNTYFGDAEDLLQSLEEDRVDVIITTKKFQSPGIEFVRLMDESFVVVAPWETEVPEFTIVKDMEQWLLEQQWISYGLDLPIIRRYWNEFFKKRPLINPAHVIPSLQLILKAIENGVGVSLLPTYLLKHDNLTKPRWKTVFDQMSVRNELFIGFKTKHKHVLVIHEFIKSIREKNEG